MVLSTAQLDKIRKFGIRFDLLTLLLDLLEEASASFGEQIHAQSEWYKRFSPECVGHLLLYTVGEVIPAKDTLDFHVLDFEAEGSDSDDSDYEIDPNEDDLLTDMVRVVKRGVKKACNTTGLKWCAVQLRSERVED